MEFDNWIIGLVVGLPPAVALAAGIALARRWVRGARAQVRGAARRLGGRIDPVSEKSGAEAMLVELKGRLLRVSATPSDRAGSGLPGALEICTPVEGSVAAVAAIRLVDEIWALHLLAEEIKSLPLTEIEEEGVLVYGHHAAMWTVTILHTQPTWALVELDSRMLRVIIRGEVESSFDSDAIERHVRGFAASLGGVLRAAGLAGSSARRGRS